MFPPALRGTTLAMIFQKRSTRTRVSTETGMALLGGHALFLSNQDLQLGVNETMLDTGAVLSRINDGIFARVNKHEHLVNLARGSHVPVINGLSDRYHPLQILADYQAIIEAFGTLDNLTVAWVGDCNNVLATYLTSAARMGLNLRVAHPEGYGPRADALAVAQRDAKEHGRELVFTTDPVVAVRGADVVVTDTWISMGDEDEAEKRLKDFQGFQVTSDLVSHAHKNWRFLHCMPRKQNEVTDEIFYSQRSLVMPEAENRLYTVMAVIMAALGKMPPHL